VSPESGEFTFCEMVGMTLRLALLAQGRLDSIRLRASEFLARYGETRRSLLAGSREKRRRDQPPLKLRLASQRPPDPQSDSDDLLKLVAEGRSQWIAVERFSASVMSPCR
jgi:hypothetical protein